MAGKRINPFFSFNYFNQNSGGGGGGAVTSVNGAIGDVTVDLDSVLAQGTTQPDGNYGLNIVSGVPTLVPIQGETVGSYKAFSTTTLPSNYLWCNGATVLIATYPDLFAVIGNTYGGDGVTTFAVPNMLDKLPKGDNGTNIGTIGGDNTLTESQLPIVNASGTISVSQNDGSVNPSNGDFFASPVDFGGSSDINGFILNGNQNPTVEIQGVNLSFGGGLPHEHPYLAVRWAICFESVGISGASPTPSFDQTLAVNNDSSIRALFNGIPYITENEIPNFINETATISDLQANQTYFYIGSTPKTFDYDLEPQPPNPAPADNITIVNLTPHVVTINSDGGNVTYPLQYFQALANTTVIDNGGTWQVVGTYLDNIYDFQQVTNKGSETTNALIVKNNPDTYRTRYSIIGQEIQKDDLGYRVLNSHFAIRKYTTSNGKSWELQYPSLDGNPNNSNFVVTVRPNVSGTLAYLEDFTNIPTANEAVITTITPYVATDNIQNIYINPAANLATANITLPPNPTNGQKVVIACGGAITSGSVVTALTVQGTAGKDILSGDAVNPTTLVAPANAGDTFTFQYSSQLSKWFII